MSRFDDLYADALRVFETRGRRRALRPLTPDRPGWVRRDGRLLLNFSSNDYLGLARDPRLAARARDWADRFGTGAGASRLVCGTLAPHAMVEARLAALKGTEAALLFASGWQANAAVLPALLRACAGEALVFADRLNHASLHHGCAAAGVPQIRFRHNDLDDLQALLDQHAGRPGRRFIITESVFSMDGDRADIPRLAAIAERFDAFLYLDEAHATGVLGPGGMGLAGLAAGVDLAMGTFSKGLGSFGAYVAGSQVLCDYLVNACSGFIYTTALPPPVLGAIDAALDLIPTMAAERTALQRRAARLREGFAALGIDTAGSSTQIVPAVIGDEGSALAVAAQLEEAGILAVAIRPPTVPTGSSRIRFALGTPHDDAAVDALLAAAARIWTGRPCAA